MAKTIEELAVEVLDAAHGDRDRARASLIRRASPAQRRQLQEEGAKHYIREVDEVRRAAAWSLTAQLPQSDRASRPGDAGLAAVNALGASVLMAYPLPETGKPLGEAVRAEVLAGSEYHEGVRDSHARRGRWLAMVAEALPNDHVTVARALDDATLQRLQEESGLEPNRPRRRGAQPAASAQGQ